MAKFGKRSRERLSTCHTDLQRLFNEVVKHHDCSILQGHRGKEKQDEAFYSTPQRSKVKWPNSKHNSVPSNAVDVMPYYSDAPHIRWNTDDHIVERELFEFVGFVKATAIQLGINVKWGGNFNGFFDGPHWEIVEG